MTEQPLPSLIPFVFNLVMSLDRDQGPKTETERDAQVDSERSSTDNRSQPPEPPHLEATTRPRLRKALHHARCDIPEKYGRLKEHYTHVRKERDHLHDHIQTMQSTIDQHVDHIDRSKSIVDALQDQLAATQAELVQVRLELQASQSVVSTEASDDGETLVDMLSVLNQKIKEFAYIVRDLVPPKMGEARFAPPKTKKGLADMGSLEALGVFAIETKMSLATVLQHGIRHKTCERLLGVLFMFFAPAIDEPLSRHLSELHRSLSLHYPQAYGSRWRAMTYNHIRPQNIDPSGAARMWVEHTLAFVNLCAPDYHPAKGTLPKNALEKATEIFRAALALQDKAKTAYLAYNYEVFAIDLGTPLNYVRDDEKKQNVEVVAVLGLGLKAWRSVPADEEQYVMEEVVPVRVSVLANA